MKAAHVTLHGVSPYRQNKRVSETRPQKEPIADFEARVWRKRMHVDASGIVYMPGAVLKLCLTESARFLSLPIPGKATETYTKHFEAGVAVPSNMSLGIKADDAHGEWRHDPANPRRAATCYPELFPWSGEVDILISNNAITAPVFETVLRAAGRVIGVGDHRPLMHGTLGRFEIDGVAWS